MKKKVILVIIFILLSVVFIASTLFFYSSPEKLGDQSILGAHRGSSVKYIENTLSAFEDALQNDKYHFIEFDIQYTKDKKIVILILIIIVLIGLAGVGSAFVWKKTDIKNIIGFGCKKLNWNKSFCVDKMPDFPEKIGEFNLTRYSKVNWEEECKEFNQKTICTRSINLEYRTSDETKLIIVAPIFVSKGAGYFTKYMSQFTGKEVSPWIFELKSKTLLSYKNKIFWLAKDVDMISLGQYAYERKSDGGLKNIQIPEGFSILDNVVSKFFREKYFPIVD